MVGCAKYTKPLTVVLTSNIRIDCLEDREAEKERKRKTKAET